MNWLLTSFLSLIVSLGVFAQGNNAPHHNVVGSWQGHNFSIIYPLGWSDEGDFTYIFQDVNGMGGAWIYNYDLCIQKSGESKPFYHKEYVYNLENDTLYRSIGDSLYLPQDSTYFYTAWLKKVLWEEYESEIMTVLKEHGIERTHKTHVQPMNNLPDDFELIFEKETDTSNVWRVDQSATFYYQIDSADRVKFFEIINELNKDGLVITDSGYEMDLLYYKIEGFIKSPVKNEYFLYVHENSMGYEEVAEQLILISLVIPD